MNIIWIPVLLAGGILNLYLGNWFITIPAILMAIVYWIDALNDNIAKETADENKWYPNETPSLFERILANIVSVRIITQNHDGRDGEGPAKLLYLRRFYLSPRWKWLPFRVFLHHILLSDNSTLHDHPWPFITTLFRGSYKQFFDGLAARISKAGDSSFYPAEHKHRLELVKPVWSLVIVGKAKREWGFWPEGKFVPWYEFLGVSKYSNNYPEDQFE